MNTTILGIDPGTTQVGFGVVKKIKGEVVYQKHGCIESRQKKLSAKLPAISGGVQKLILKTKPTAVAIEKIFFFKNLKTAIDVSHARGVILLVCSQQNIPIFEYTPLEIKQALTGYGRAHKLQIQKMVQAILGLKSLPRPDDAADALACAICHAHTLRPN